MQGGRKGGLSSQSTRLSLALSSGVEEAFKKSRGKGLPKGDKEG